MNIIYKDFGGYKMTNEANYNAYIRNERQVVDFSAFSSADEIIAYCVKYFGGSTDDYMEVK